MWESLTSKSYEEGRKSIRFAFRKQICNRNLLCAISCVCFWFGCLSFQTSRILSRHGKCRHIEIFIWRHAKMYVPGGIAFWGARVTQFSECIKSKWLRFQRVILSRRVLSTPFSLLLRRWETQVDDSRWKSPTSRHQTAPSEVSGAVT